MDALSAGIAYELATEAEVLPRAVTWAAAMSAKDRQVLRAHKELLYGEAIRTCGLFASGGARLLGRVDISLHGLRRRCPGLASGNSDGRCYEPTLEVTMSRSTAGQMARKRLVSPPSPTTAMSRDTGHRCLGTSWT